MVKRSAPMIKCSTSGPSISNFFKRASAASVSETGASGEKDVAEVYFSSNPSHREPNEPNLTQIHSPFSGVNTVERVEPYTTDEALDWDETKASIPFSSLCALFQRIEVFFFSSI